MTSLAATVFPVTSTEKLTWNCDFFGGINVYQDGRIFITEDTPVGTTATITVFSGKKHPQPVRLLSFRDRVNMSRGNWAIVKNPECTKEGLRRSICTKCAKVREEPVAATGHSWLSKTVTDATCDAVGEREDTCQNCGEKKREVIPAKGHDWASNGTIKTEPTCTKAGEMEYVCNICKKTMTEPIPANGHSWDLGEITKSPTCTAAGVRTYHCTVDGCAGTKKETIEATGHTWTYGKITEEPGCTTRGKRLHTSLPYLRCKQHGNTGCARTHLGCRCGVQRTDLYDQWCTCLYLSGLRRHEKRKISHRLDMIWAAT